MRCKSLSLQRTCLLSFLNACEVALSSFSDTQSLSERCLFLPKKQIGSAVVSCRLVDFICGANTREHLRQIRLMVVYWLFEFFVLKGG